MSRAVVPLLIRRATRGPQNENQQHEPEKAAGHGAGHDLAVVVVVVVELGSAVHDRSQRSRESLTAHRTTTPLTSVD